MLIDLLFLGFFVLLLIFGIKVEECQEDSKMNISLDQTNFIRGIAALFVLFHHLAQNAGGKLFCYMGYSSVAVFFFVSGYGIMYCYLTKKGYINALIQKKIPKLIRWCLFTLVMNVIYWCIEGGWHVITVKEIILSFYGNRMLNWFFPFLILHYVMFVVSIKLFPKNINASIRMLFVLTGGYFFVCAILGVHASRYFSSICFPIGGLFASYANAVSPNRENSSLYNVFCGFIKKRNRVMLIPFLCFGVMLLAAIILPDKNIVIINWTQSGCYILSAIMFVGGVLLFSYGKRSSVIEYIGKHSGEMILLQGIGISICRSKIIYIDNTYLYIMSSCVIMVLLMMLFIPIYKRI